MTFQDEMFERLEDAADAAVLARFNEACPKAEYGWCEAMWMALVVRSATRKEAREKLEHYLDLNLFNENGKVKEYVAVGN